MSAFRLEEATFVLVPLGASYLVGNVTHSLELGAGVTLGTASSVDGSGAQAFVSVPVTVGYCYQPPDGGFLFRAAAMPRRCEAPPVILRVGATALGSRA